MTNRKKKGCLSNLVNRFVCIVVCLLVLAIVAGTLGWYFIFYKQDDPHPIASCGDCHCIVGTDPWLTCPERVPKTNFTQSEIDIWESQIALNAYTLDCNPYDNEVEVTVGDDNLGDNETMAIEQREQQQCQTEPPQNATLLDQGGTAVCAVHFERDHAQNDKDERQQICESDATYRLKTYASRSEAVEAGGFVTHVGHCGVCSSLQDLAAYVRAGSSDLSSQGKFCSKQGLVSFDVGLDCFREELGMTEACAAIWSYSARNTAKECFGQCLLVEGSSTFFISDQANNGPPPECKLNDCLQCDEDMSGEVFERIAGRTHLRSGLLSTIARPCDQMVNIIQEACPETQPLLDEW